MTEGPQQAGFVARLHGVGLRYGPVTALDAIDLPMGLCTNKPVTRQWERFDENCNQTKKPGSEIRCRCFDCTRTILAEAFG